MESHEARENEQRTLEEGMHQGEFSMKKYTQPA
jgi:hypothetical protein